MESRSKGKVLLEIEDVESEIQFLFGLSKKVEKFKLKPNLNPKVCLFDSSVFLREGKEEEALKLLLGCRSGIEATLTTFLRKSWIFFEARFKNLKRDYNASLDPEVLREIMEVLRDEKRCVLVDGELDIEEATELYSKAVYVLRYATRELHYKDKKIQPSPTTDDLFSQKWRRFAVADDLCRVAEMLP